MRLPDWEERLATLTHEAQTRVFGWGMFDCCVFAAEAVEAVTGRNPMDRVRTLYDDAATAARLVRRLGGLREAVTHALGVEPTAAVKCAQRGDIVLVRQPKQPALGVVIGQSALVPLAHGVQRVSMGDWLAAWRVE
jgi:hypothetical protein